MCRVNFIVCLYSNIECGNVSRRCCSYDEPLPSEPALLDKLLRDAVDTVELTDLLYSDMDTRKAAFADWSVSLLPSRLGSICQKLKKLRESKAFIFCVHFFFRLLHAYLVDFFQMKTKKKKKEYKYRQKVAETSFADVIPAVLV